MDENKIDEVFKNYKEGKISLGKSSEIAEVSIWRFLDLMKERKIQMKYNLDDIKKEADRIVNNQ